MAGEAHEKSEVVKEDEELKNIYVLTIELFFGSCN